MVLKHGFFANFVEVLFLQRQDKYRMKKQPPVRIMNAKSVENTFGIKRSLRNTYIHTQS